MGIRSQRTHDVFNDPSTIYGDAKGEHVVPTPRRMEMPLWKSRVQMPSEPPPQPLKITTQISGRGQQQPPPEPPRMSNSFTEWKLPLLQPPQQQNQVEAGGLNPRRLGAHYSSVPPPPPQSEGQLSDALARALVTALAAQNRTTERFVARQSQGSSLPSFGGNPLDWPIFAHHYRQSTEDCGFTPAMNMASLEKALKGEARRHVRALMIVPENAEEVMTRLEQRYGRPEFVVQALVEIARKTPTLKEGKLSSIVDFAGAVMNLVTTIRTLRIPTYLNNPQLKQELVDKLPDGLKLQWGMKSLDIGSNTLVHFAEWIDRVAEGASKVSTPKLNFREKRKDGFSAAVEEAATSSSPSRSCPMCRRDGHSASSCERFKKMTVDDRWKLVKENNLCFRCLGRNHSIKDCRVKWTCKAKGCTKKHHTMLHGQVPVPRGKYSSDAVEVNANVNQADGGGAILRIVAVTLYGPGGKISVNALLDEGSTVTLVSDTVAKSLDLKGPQDPLRLRWTDGSLQTESGSRKVACFISPVDNDKVQFRLKNVRTVASLKLPPQRTDLEGIAGPSSGSQV